MSKLRTTLNQLYSNYLTEFQHSPKDFFERKQDPLRFPHRYSEFHDVEAAAFLAATFAYGNVKALCGFVQRLLELLGPSPYHFFLQGEPAIDGLMPSAPYYRLQKTEEILSFLFMMSNVYRNHGSLYEVFLKSYDNHSTTRECVSRFVNHLYEIHGSPVPFLLPLPEGGSPCKRLNLFFRWMVRNDGLDLGIWEKVSPASLIMPLDTHIGRVAYKLGWLKTQSLSWKKAEAITEILRKFNREDPIRYDFALCHESMSKSDLLRKLSL